MSEHTPGPWKYGVRRDGSMWLSLGNPEKGPHYQGDLVASEADARLIAAAPDLLAACEVVVAFLDRLEDGDESLLRIRQRVHAPLRAALEPAIAKAEGRS